MKQVLFFGFFIMRRMFFSFIIVCMKEFTKHQLILILFTFSWVLLYAVRSSPYKTQLNNFLNTFNESILVVFVLVLFLFVDTQDSTRIERAGWTCIGIIVTFFIVNWIIIFPVVIYTTIKSWTVKKKKKRNSLIKLNNSSK